MFKPILAISLGASLGAVLRWWLGGKLNSLFPAIPLGTLSSNLIGGYLVGCAIAFFLNAHHIALEWRLFIITGFCGGLTTFSTFSAETVNLLQHGRMGLAAAMISLHVVGSLLATLAGLFSWQLLRSF